VFFEDAAGDAADTALGNATTLQEVEIQISVTVEQVD
jgi:hypothetical protein